MGFATGDHHHIALRRLLLGLLQMLGQAAGIATCGLGGRAQPFTQTFGHGAEIHFFQRFLAQGFELGIVGTQARGVLLGAPHGQIQHLRHLGQLDGVGQSLRTFVDDGHQLVLIVNKHQLRLGSV